jgi:uncharacterized membrane protein (UPF0182 family)
LLKKVLVAFGDKIAFEDTLTAALDSLFGGNSGAVAGDTPTVVTPSQPGATGNASAALKAALAKARQAMIDKDQAMAAGDWTAYGKADKALKAALDAALAATK